MVWSVSATCTRLWWSMYPHDTRKVSLVRVEMRRPDTSECHCQNKHQCDRSWVFFSCMVVESVHLEQGFPHRGLCFSIPPVSCIPNNPMSLLPSRHLWRPQPFSPEPQKKSNGPLTRGIFWNQEKTSSRRLLLSTSAAIPPNFSALQSSTACPPSLAPPCRKMSDIPLFLLQNLHSSCWSFCERGHTADQLLVFFLHHFILILLLHLMQPTIRSAALLP